MKAKKIIISIILAMSFAISLASCAKPADDPAEATTAPSVDTTAPAETEKSLYDEKGYLLDELPELDFKGETVKILYWSDVERPEFEIKEEQLDGSIVKDAIYNRNERTQQRLKVNFEWIGTKGNTSNRAAFAKFTEDANASGDYFDIIATYSKTSGLIITKGLVKDINKIEESYLDFSKPWWPESMYSTCSIGKGLYSVSGDISTNVLHFMYAVYYNQQMILDLGLEDPVKYVDAKTWTLDKMISMTKGLYVDLDNDGKISVGDQYGFGSEFYHTDALYFGAGLKLLEADPDELLVVSEDYTSQKAIDLFDTLKDWYKTGDAIVKVSGNSYDYVTPFVNGTMLFELNRVYIADQQSSSGLHNVTWNYGLVPAPMYDEDQDRYYTIVGNPITLWSVGYGISDAAASRATAVMECMASNAYRLTTPAIFDTNMKYRYTTDEKGDAVRMFDIIHDTITFDLGRFFADATNTMSEIPTTVAAQGNSWGTVCKAQVKPIKKGVENQVVAAIRNFYGD
ncbi:MAG: hypothetical protein MJ137_04990 [Clostridia bacterium]|nr:hypothetical protein [Clostridia bacterium]